MTASLTVKTCARCRLTWDPNIRADRNVFCPSCEKETADRELYAVVYDDMSGIVGLFEEFTDARDELSSRPSGAVLRKVVGQAGARALLRDRTDAEWDHRDAAYDQADYHESTGGTS